jgi:alpha-L-rhamnosidase
MATRFARQLTIAALLAGSAQAARAEAEWISHPAVAGEASREEAVSLQFRRVVDLAAVPDRLEINISADNRYILYVNGRQVDAGPSRGDLSFWRYRRIDIARFLKTGRNVIAAQVWNDGKAAGVAQISARTGFWLDADDGAVAGLDSGGDWQVRLDASRTVSPAQPGLYQRLGGKYFAAPPPETHDASQLARGWTTAADELADWQAPARALEPGEASPWALVEDRLPQMRMQPMDGGKLVRAWGIRANRFPERKLTIPANSEVVLRLDMGAVRAAYPRLVTSGGKGAEVALTYVEAPYGEDLEHLPDRGDATSGWILGLTDHFRPGGGRNEVFAPFWWRAWRYAELRVKTGTEALTLEAFDRTGTGYPFETVASFSSDDPELARIWQVGWDTVQLDGHETYMDTAYWEQLQYVGDTRIQALVSYAVSDDPRLAAQAIEAFAASRRDGLIQSRYPADLFQSIPPFALLWVGMLHDYWMRQPDPRPVREALDAMRSSLDWYAKYVEPDGLVGTTSGWEFIDWRDGLSNFPETTDPRETERCIVSLMYYGALRQAAELEAAIGDGARASLFAGRANPLAQAIRDRCWSAERGIFADQPAKTSFSQHANVLAVLYDVAPKGEQQAILQRVLADGDWPNAPDGIVPATYYFDFYLARALAHAGMGNDYLRILAPWRQMLAQNFTTWPESPDPSRSDTHAWSAHPTFDLLTIVAGIDTAAPGFAKVRIEPHLGQLRRLAATYAHPAGPISVSYAVDQGGSLNASIVLPTGVEGEFVWRGVVRPLAAGTNTVSVANQ